MNLACDVWFIFISLFLGHIVHSNEPLISLDKLSYVANNEKLNSASGDQPYTVFVRKVASGLDWDSVETFEKWCFKIGEGYENIQVWFYDI